MKGPAAVPVVAGIFSRWDSGKKEPQVLLFQRAADDVGGGHWEFPGGKIEFGESDIQALKRELEEEISIKVRVQELLGKSLFHAPSGKVYELRLYFVEGPLGEIILNEHQGMKWVTPQTIVLDEVAEGDRPLVSACFEALQKKWGAG